MGGLPPQIADDDDYCYLTTRGRVTGHPHEIEIWFAAEGTRLHLLSGGRERADWVRNLRVHPAVTVRLGGTTYAAVARVLEHGSPEDVSARARVFRKYTARGYGHLERWRDSALVVALEVGDTAPTE